MPDKVSTRERYGEAFWRKHHEARKQSTLNQREYCEAHGIPLGLELLVAATSSARVAAPSFESLAALGPVVLI
jgi:uncharacterized membrane protein